MTQTDFQNRQTDLGPRPIGFFYHLRLNDRHMGGILVTDRIGIPLEFKYTEPVTATRLHKILYGRTLERYLHETVIRDRLGKELQTDPEFFLTPYEDREYLGMLAGREMFAVQLHKFTPGESHGSFMRLREREAIVEIEDGPSLRLAFSTPDERLQQSMAARLQEIGRTMDVLEPLERVASALAALCGDGRKD
jgi:hypothetical protein